MPNNLAEIDDYVSKGKVWFIPNSFAQPIKLKFKPENAIVRPRSSNGTIACYCEEPKPDSPDGSDCHWVGTGCIKYYCAECDEEFCEPSNCYSETLGGGVILLADTVICLNTTTNIVFGGRTKINWYVSNNTLYFHRKYIDSSEVFSKYYFNTSGTTVSDLNSNLWLIPFDKSIQASQTIGKECKSDPDHPCIGTCQYDQQPNGCLRCKCSSSSSGGDCDYMDANSNHVPEGVIVSTANISEY